jgi:uncharacterized membrane protein YqiK
MFTNLFVGQSILGSLYFFPTILAGVAVVTLVLFWLLFRYIPNNNVGVVEKLWSLSGSVAEGGIIALNCEAGFQSQLLRGGIHFGYWRWQYRVHKAPLVTISQGKIGYVYARDGEPLPPSQVLARQVESNSFQDALAFLVGSMESDFIRGQRGRQRTILREGVYAINPALFVAITDERVYTLSAIHSSKECNILEQFRNELAKLDGFTPVIIGRLRNIDSQISENSTNHSSHSSDELGVVTVHDGLSLASDEIIAPVVGQSPEDSNYHNNFQDPEAFLRAGGFRGRQYATLTDGTYFINRWFATVEKLPKTVVPIGSVGVVVSYVGRRGSDVSGKLFRHGEQVASGEKGVWETPLGPGKYAFNTYAGNMIMVPTTNFVLHWITGRSESHMYDETLRSIDLVTKDAYEPILPLSVVVHIDYERAASVIQRFGDVKKLITQTIDPMLSAFFRDVAHRKTMLELLHERDVIQNEARLELRNKFRQFDIECVEVLIGKSSNVEGDDKIETLLEQLRQRQLSTEQLETYERRKHAAQKLQELKAAEAQAEMQTKLTNAEVQARIANSEGEAELARSRKHAERTVVDADAELARSKREAEQRILLAEAESRQRTLIGKGESQKILQIGLSEAAVLTRKIRSLGDPRLYAIQEVAAKLANSQQPLVPQRLFVTANSGEDVQFSSSTLGTLLQLLVAEKSGWTVPELSDNDPLGQFADKMSEAAMSNLQDLLKP